MFRRQRRKAKIVRSVLLRGGVAYCTLLWPRSPISATAELLSTFQFAVEGVQGQIKSADMCRRVFQRHGQQHRMLDIQDVNLCKTIQVHDSALEIVEIV